jgi:putative photosynthetic complex assembly protein
MSGKVYSDKDRLIPKPLLIGLSALILASLTFTAYARISGQPLSSVPPDAPLAREVAVLLDSQFAAGQVVVRNADGSFLQELGQDGGGFVSTIHRVILRERGLHKAPAEGPIHIREYENGRLAVFDPSTGYEADLMAFGESNIAVFASLITQSQTNGGRTDGTAYQRN